MIFSLFLKKLTKYYPLVFSTIIKLLAIGLGLYISRWQNKFFSPDDLKNYNLIIVYNSIVFGILGLGIANLVYKFYTNENDKLKQKEFWTTILLFQIVLYFLGVILVFIIYYFSNIFNFYLLLTIFTAQYILLIDSNFKSIGDTLNRNWIFNISEFFAKALVMFILFFWSKELGINSLLYFAYTILAIYFLEFLFDWFTQREYTQLSVPSFSLIKDNKRFFFFMGLSNFFNSISSTTDKWFLNFFGYNSYVINGYSNTFKLAEIILVPFSIAIPVFASWAKKSIDKGESSKLLLKYVDLNLPFSSYLRNRRSSTLILIEWLLICTFAGIIISLIFLVLARFGLILIDSDRVYYEWSAEIIPLFAYAILPIGVIGFMSNMTIIFEKDNYEFYTYIIFAFSAILLYIILIPPFGHYGAIIASGVTNWIFAISKWFAFSSAYTNFLKNQKYKSNNR
jgi:O-antigen/teichoic acid export membrane protein